MTPKQIKRAKRLAEMLFSKESYGVQERGSAVWVCHNSGTVWKPFNPEQDKALLWDLFLKNKDSMLPSKLEFLLEDGTGAAAALIDCVIAINGGYDEANK